MMAGIAGVALGSILSNRLKHYWATADPVICGIGLLLSSPLLLGATYAATANPNLCYFLLFLGQLTLNLNWAIVCDIVLVRNIKATNNNKKRKRKKKEILSVHCVVFWLWCFFFCSLKYNEVQTKFFF